MPDTPQPRTDAHSTTQHAADEFCFFCVPDELILRGLTAHDEDKPYEGPTIHMQVPATFCPHWDTEDDE